MAECQSADIAGYRYSDGGQTCAHAYLLPVVFAIIEGEVRRRGAGARVFDLGCGNGVVASAIAKRGLTVTGVDPSTEGIDQAKRNYPDLSLHIGSAYDDLAAAYGQFDILVSLEVVEHVYAPRDYARSAYQLLRPGGLAIISTPYNGYLKNLAIAALGGFDRHVTALWDHGHIKFWSVKTLTTLLGEAGFNEIKFSFAGRVPWLAKSMIACARRPTP